MRPSRVWSAVNGTEVRPLSSPRGRTGTPRASHRYALTVLAHARINLRHRAGVPETASDATRSPGHVRARRAWPLGGLLHQLSRAVEPVTVAQEPAQARRTYGTLAQPGQRKTMDHPSLVSSVRLAIRHGCAAGGHSLRGGARLATGPSSGVVPRNALAKDEEAARQHVLPEVGQSAATNDHCVRPSAALARSGHQRTPWRLRPDHTA